MRGIRPRLRKTTIQKRDAATGIEPLKLPNYLTAQFTRKATLHRLCSLSAASDVRMQDHEPRETPLAAVPQITVHMDCII